jgi:hypothetical protein
MRPAAATTNQTTRDDVIMALAELARRRARREPVFFVENFLMTFDPRPSAPAHHLDFILYDFQKEYVQDLVVAIRTGDDRFIEKSRDMGITWVTLAVLLWFWLFADGFQAILGSRKQDFVDSKTMESLFPKLEYMIRHIKDSSLLPAGFKMTEHRTFLKLVNPANGNAIVGESANPNFSRSGRYTVAMLDELGFWPDAERSWASASESSPCRLAITTPPDKPSFAKGLRFSGRVKVLTYLWRLHPNKDGAWYELQKKKKTESEMLHEIDISWEYSASGRPYPEIDKVGFGQFAYDETLPLYLSLDIGRDAVAIGWWQPVRGSGYLTLIEAYENHNKIVDWYVPFMGGAVNSEFIYSDDDLRLIEQIKYWKKPTCYGDPSGKQWHIESERGAPYTVLQDQYGIYVQSNTKQNDYSSRRDETKRLLVNMRANDTPGTQYWKTCITSAHYPEAKENSQSVNEVVKPVHDWTSHMRTMTEFLAVNYQKPIEPEEYQDEEIFKDGFYY